MSEQENQTENSVDNGIGDNEVLKVRKGVLADFIIRDRKQHLVAQQTRYRAMREIDKIGMRTLFSLGGLFVLEVILLLWTILMIIVHKDLFYVFVGVLNVISLFMFAMSADEIVHWWDEEEVRTGGYLADTETD